MRRGTDTALFRSAMVIIIAITIITIIIIIINSSSICSIIRFCMFTYLESVHMNHIESSWEGYVPSPSTNRIYQSSSFGAVSREGNHWHIIPIYPANQQFEVSSSSVKQHKCDSIAFSLGTESHIKCQVAQRGKHLRLPLSALQRLAATAFLSKLVHHALHIDSGIQVIIIKVHTVPLQHHWVDLKSYPLVNVYRKLWKITMLFMGKSTISMAIFHVAFCMFTRAPKVSIIWAPPSNGKHPSRQS